MHWKPIRNVFFFTYTDETDDRELQNTDLFAAPKKKIGRQRRDAITDEELSSFQETYPNEAIGKEDYFLLRLSFMVYCTQRIIAVVTSTIWSKGFVAHFVREIGDGFSGI